MDQITAAALSAWVASVSAGAAILSVILNIHVLSQAKRNNELALLDRIFSGIVELEVRLYDSMEAGNGKESFLRWRGLFLNRLEYFSFLVNHNHLRDESMVAFWGDAIICWYREIFLKYAEDTDLTDPKLCAELKLLYAKLNSGINSTIPE